MVQATICNCTNLKKYTSIRTWCTICMSFRSLKDLYSPKYFLFCYNGLYMYISGFLNFIVQIRIINLLLLVVIHVWNVISGVLEFL